MNFFKRKKPSIPESIPDFPTDVCQEAPKNIYKLETKESPKEVLTKDFPTKQWPISGGWGYDQNHAVVIKLDKEDQGVPFERYFMRFRINEEINASQPVKEIYSGIDFQVDKQMLINKDGKAYDLLEGQVIACTNADFNFLKKDWESHNGYKGDINGYIKHRLMYKSKTITYKTRCWFDISQYFGKL